MSIDQLSTLLDEIKGYVDDYRVVKEENNRLRATVASLQEQISQIQATLAEKENEISTKVSEIATLEANVSDLQEAANLNLVKAQEIVNELKEIVNA